MTPRRMKIEIPRYYRIWVDADRAAMEAIVGEVFSFTSPYDDHIDRDEFFRRCWPNAGRIGSFDVEQVLPDGDDGALVLYEATLGNGNRIRNVEHMRFAGDRLRSVEVFFGLGPDEKPTTPAAWAAAREGASS